MDQTMAGPGALFGLFGLATMLLYVLVTVVVLLPLARGAAPSRIPARHGPHNRAAR
jgi:hypothetical protein